MQPRARHSSSSLSARTTDSTSTLRLAAQRPRPRTTLDALGNPTADAHAAHAGAVDPMHPLRAMIDQSASGSSHSNNGTGVGGARPVWSNGHAGGSRSPASPLPAMPSRFHSKEIASSPTNAAASGIAATAVATQPRVRRAVPVGATSPTNSGPSSGFNSARAQGGNYVGPDAPLKVSTPSSLAELLALSASAQALQVPAPAARTPLQPARSRSRGNLAAPSPQQGGPTTSVNARQQSTGGSTLFASHGTPAPSKRSHAHQRPSPPAAAAAASFVDVLVPLPMPLGSSAGGSTPPGPGGADALSDLLPQARALTLASRVSPSKLPSPPLAKAAPGAPFLEDAATPALQRPLVPLGRKRGGEVSSTTSRATTLPVACASLHDEIPPEGSAAAADPEQLQRRHLQARQRAARRQHHAAQVPSLSLPLASTAKAVAQQQQLQQQQHSASVSSTLQSASAASTTHFSQFSRSDEEEDQLVQESLASGSGNSSDSRSGAAPFEAPDCDTTTNRDRDAECDEDNLDDDDGEEEDSCDEEGVCDRGVAQVQGSFDGAFFDAQAHAFRHKAASLGGDESAATGGEEHPAMPAAEAAAAAEEADDDPHQDSEYGDSYEENAPAQALSPPFVRRAHAPAAAPSEALEVFLGAAAAMEMEEQQQQRLQQQVEQEQQQQQLQQQEQLQRQPQPQAHTQFETLAPRPCTPPPAPLGWGLRPPTTNSTTSVCGDDHHEEDAAVARSCSSLPRAPSALQHSREARGRVSAASLRPFTPNVAPVASEPPTPQQAPQPEPAQPPPPPAVRAPARNARGGKAPVRGKGAAVLRGGASEKGRAPAISSSAFPPLPAAPLAPAAAAASAIPASAPASAAASAAAAGGTASSSSPPALAPSDEVSLTYDAVLKCYWDPAANIYYELNTINL